jgi:hypothetical protein
MPAQALLAGSTACYCPAPGPLAAGQPPTAHRHRPPLCTAPAQALLWLAYSHVFLQADVAAGLRCLEELRATPEAQEICRRPVCTVIALKACLLAQQGDQACGELLRLVDNEAAEQEMCLVAAVECMEVRQAAWTVGAAALGGGWRRVRAASCRLAQMSCGRRGRG